MKYQQAIEMAEWKAQTTKTTWVVVKSESKNEYKAISERFWKTANKSDFTLILIIDPNRSPYR